MNSGHINVYLISTYLQKNKGSSLQRPLQKKKKKRKKPTKENPIPYYYLQCVSSCFIW